jgi:hypothetical protein
MSLQDTKADSPAKYRHSRSRWHYWLKRFKARLERRRAKKDPECDESYGKYKGGWEL